jgi:glucose-1-phosphate thymidylyltransferase
MIEVPLVSTGPRRKGIVMAGGHGTRLHPMTIPVSKQLLPVYDKPLIYYPLSVLMLAGVREVLLVTTPRDGPRFHDLLGDGSRWGMSFSYVTQSEPRGLPEAFLLGEEFLAGDPSLMVLGDNLLYGARLPEQLRAASEGTTGACLFAHRVNDPRDFGVVVLDDGGRPLELVEKPLHPPSPWAITGLYLVDGDAPLRARDLAPSRRGELEMVDLLGSYLADGILRVVKLGRGVTWLDTGNPRALLQASHFVEVLQERQGLRVACPEEIAYRMGYINADALERLGRELGATGYGEYLRNLVQEERRGGD